MSRSQKDFRQDLAGVSESLKGSKDSHLQLTSQNLLPIRASNLASSTSIISMQIRPDMTPLVLNCMEGNPAERTCLGSHRISVLDSEIESLDIAVTIS